MTSLSSSCTRLLFMRHWTGHCSHCGGRALRVGNDKHREWWHLDRSCSYLKARFEVKPTYHCACGKNCECMCKFCVAERHQAKLVQAS